MRAAVWWPMLLYEIMSYSDVPLSRNLSLDKWKPQHYTFYFVCFTFPQNFDDVWSSRHIFPERGVRRPRRTERHDNKAKWAFGIEAAAKHSPN